MRIIPASAVAIGLAAVLAVHAPAQQRPPSFKAGVSFVHVDVYPRFNGRIVTDLRQDEFEVLEDGVPQTIETFEHVQPRVPGTESERGEPRSARESDEAAADPRTRLFVVFFDTLHMVGYHGAEGEAATEDNQRTPAFSFAPRANTYDPTTAGKTLATFVRELMGADDLIGLMTPDIPVQRLTFTRQPLSLEAFLVSGGEWRTRFLEGYADDAERQYVLCYPPEVNKFAGIAASMIARRREMRVLNDLRNLVTHLQTLREGRKAVIVVSEGWTLFTPDPGFKSAFGLPGRNGPTGDTPPPGGVRVGGAALLAQCEADRIMLMSLDNERTFRDMVGEANRANVTFYPVDPQGLPVRPERRRLDSLDALALNTDGIVVGNSNDFKPGLERIRDDVSSYYLLGYNSTNTKFDGRFRKITVRVKRPGVLVRARRGYLAPTREEVTAIAAASAPPDPEKTLRDTALSALGLERSDSPLHVAAGYAFDGSGTTRRQTLWIVGELEGRAARTIEWSRGGTATVTVSGVAGAPMATEHVSISPAAPRFNLRVDRPNLEPGDYLARVRLTNGPDGLADLVDQVRVALPALRVSDRAAVLAPPMLFRRATYAGAEYQPTADRRFRRTEMIRVDAPLAGTVEDARASLLDRNGRPLPIPVTATFREAPGERFVTAEATLAALAPADYLIQVQVRHGETVEKVLAAFRIVP